MQKLLVVEHDKFIDDFKKVTTCPCYREIKHDIIQEMANASLPFIFLPFYRII